MKKLSAVVMALVACLLIGTVTVAVAKKQKIHKRTSITLTVKVTPPSPYAPYSAGSGLFSGKITASKACRKDRLVTIKRNGTAIGNTTSDDNGNYSFTTNTAPAPGTYTAKAHKKTYHNKPKTKTFICSHANSNSVVVP